MSDIAYKKYTPAQIRTFVGTLAGDRTPMTEEDFTPAELTQARNAVVQSRKRNTIPVFPSDSTGRYVVGPPEQRFTGDTTVGYQDYPEGKSARQDYNVTPSAAIRNTLGRFKYEKTPEGRLVATDNYDFKNDMVSQGARPTAAYTNMNPVQKIVTLVGDTVTDRKGISTLPSRVGSAFIGDTSRPVRLDLGEAPEGMKKGGKVEAAAKKQGKTQGKTKTKARGVGIARKGHGKGTMR